MSSYRPWGKKTINVNDALNTHFIRQVMLCPKRTRLRKGPTPLLRQHGTFLRRVLQNVKMGNIPIPPKLIKGTPRNQIGKGRSTLCCYKTGPRRIKALLAGKNPTGGFPLAALARYAIPIALSFLYDRITDRKDD